MYNIELNGDKDLYVRIPKKLSDIELKKFVLELSKKLEGKTLKISVLDSGDASIPFRCDVIKQTTDDAEMVYFGTSYYWEPECVHTGKVKDHRECDFPCDPDCRAVTCPVYQGFEQELPDKYFISEKMRDEDD